MPTCKSGLPRRDEVLRCGDERCLLVTCGDGEDERGAFGGDGSASGERVEDVGEVRLKRHDAVKFDIHFWLGGKMGCLGFCCGNDGFLRRTVTVRAGAMTIDQLVDGGLHWVWGCHVER